MIFDFLNENFLKINYIIHINDYIYNNNRTKVYFYNKNKIKISRFNKIWLLNKFLFNK